MKASRVNIIRREFIGAEAKIVKSKHQGYVGISGKIIDETRNTFVILRNGERKRIAKDSSIFQFIFSDETTVEVEGRLLIGRPESRLKKSIKRLW